VLKGIRVSPKIRILPSETALAGYANLMMMIMKKASVPKTTSIHKPFIGF